MYITLKKQFYRLAQVPSSLLDGVTLARNVQFRTQCDENVSLALDKRG